MANLQIPYRSLEVQVDGQTPESWSVILTQFADASIYQTWAYGAVRWSERNLSHLVLRREDHVLGAAQLRIARVPMLPAGVAYLRWGPLCQVKGRPLDLAVVDEMVARLRHEYVNRRGLALQIIPSAFFESDRAAALQSAFSRSGLHPESSLGRYRTIIVDLSPVAEVLRKRLDQKWRNQLNRAEKNGLALEVSDQRDAYREFVSLYRDMWARKRFETSVDVEEFDRIQGLLSGPSRMQTFLAKKDGQCIGALVCSLIGDAAIYLLGATNERARELKAAYFLHWQAMLWLKEHGALCYDLGGIDPDANPGGYHFKSGLGGAELAQAPAHSCTDRWLSRGVAAFATWRRRAQVVNTPATPASAAA